MLLEATVREPLGWRFWSKVHFTDDCWLWTSTRNELGYGMFGLKVAGVQANATCASPCL